MGSHPYPSRTRRLRPKRPMVLHWRRCGRAGGCRHPFKKQGKPERAALSYNTRSRVIPAFKWLIKHSQATCTPQLMDSIHPLACRHAIEEKGPKRSGERAPVPSGPSLLRRTLKTAYRNKLYPSVKRKEIGKDIRGVTKVTYQKEAVSKGDKGCGAIHEGPEANAMAEGRPDEQLSAHHQVKHEGRRVDALALRADEGRDKLRKASGRSKYPLIRRSPNGETHMRRTSCIHTPIHNVWRGTA